MRLVAGIALVVHGATMLRSGPRIEAPILSVFACSAGILLLAGLWTPIAGTLVASIELWRTFSQATDPSDHILLATIGAALAMLGPGAWSVDGRLFGWKRISSRDRRA
jgi:putative oxidoreductase